MNTGEQNAEQTFYTNDNKYFKIEEDPETEQFQIYERDGRFGVYQPVEETYDTVEDAEQVLVGLADSHGFSEVSDQVLEP